ERRRIYRGTAQRPHPRALEERYVGPALAVPLPAPEGPCQPPPGQAIGARDLPRGGDQAAADFLIHESGGRVIGGDRLELLGTARERGQPLALPRLRVGVVHDGAP